MGSTVSIVYDAKYPSRSALGNPGDLYGEWKISSFFNQARYAILWAILGLVGAAIKAKLFDKK